MSSPRIEVLVGMIGSGKSTYCKRRAQDGAIIVNDDSIVTMLHGGFYSGYRSDLKPLYKTVENNAVYMAICMGQAVVIDRTNLSIDSRRRWIGLAKCLDTVTVAVTFPQASPEEHARRRFASDARGYSLEQWVKVANHHREEYVEPTVDEGFDFVVPYDVALQMAEVIKAEDGENTKD